MLTAPAIYAEDDPNDAYFMCHAFKKGGLDTPLVIIPDGQQVVDYLGGVGQYADRKAYPLPCMLLLDLKLPRKNGFEVLDWIGQQQIPLKVVVVSSSGQSSDIAAAKNLGAVDYVIKPSSPAKLVEVVRQLHEKWVHNGTPNGFTAPPSAVQGEG